MFLLVSPNRGVQVAIKRMDQIIKEERVEHDYMYSSGTTYKIKSIGT